VNMMGDLTRCTGVVTGKAVKEDGDHVIQIEVGCESQRGPSTQGSAEIALPSRDPATTATV
jgi:hypothetical protein